MTLAIAWINKKAIYIAADRRVVTPDHGIVEDTKIFDAHGLTFAFAGDVVVEHALRHQDFAAREDGCSVPKWWANDVLPWLSVECKDREYQMIVTDGADVFVTMDGLLRKTTACLTAIGSAAMYAYGYVDGMWYGSGYSDDFHKNISERLVALFDAASLRHESVGDEHDVRVLKKKRGKK